MVLRCEICKLRLIFYSNLRYDFENISKEDWLPFCFNASFIIHEDIYRQELGLERIALKYYKQTDLANFMNIMQLVLKGDKNPSEKIHAIFNRQFENILNQRNL